MMPGPVGKPGAARNRLGWQVWAELASVSADGDAGL